MTLDHARRGLFAPITAVLICFGAFFCAGIPLIQDNGAQAAEPVAVVDSSAGPIAVSKIAGPLENPWALAFLPDGRQLVTEIGGRLLLIDQAGRMTPVAGLPEIAEYGQGGLLDIAVAPDFAESGRVYFSFAERVGAGILGADHRTALASARLSLEPEPVLAEVTVIFGQSPALDGRRHFGSRIVLDREGAVFLALGDRGQAPLAQDLSTHIGKIIRVTPDDAPAPGAPFAGAAGAQAEIWSYGHRNIQGAVLDPTDGALWTIEHGARGGDELNRPEAGKNYGWPVISYGRHYSGAKIGVGTEAPGMEQPVYYWDPSIAPSGLTYYDGDLFPEWRGDLLAGALKYELIARLDLENGAVAGEERLFEGRFGRIRDVRTGPDGAIWFLTDESDGALYRAAPPNR